MTVQDEEGLHFVKTLINNQQKKIKNKSINTLEIY